MDTELLRTFLEVNKTRHFAKAAQNLFITQAAVSARVTQLEGLVGHRVFTRTRNNIQLTTAGQQLVPYAESVLDTWSRALLACRSQQGDQPLLVVGCLPSLREIYLDPWILNMSETRHDWLLQIKSATTHDLVNAVRESALSVGILYEPPRAPDLWVEPVGRFDLILVASTAGLRMSDPQPNYIDIDWGAAFKSIHSADLAHASVATIKLDTPRLARLMLLKHGGSAYLPNPMVVEDIKQRHLHRVADAPVIEREVFLIGRSDSENESAISRLRKTLLDLLEKNTVL